MQSPSGICSQICSAYMGGVSAVLARLVVPARPVKMSAPFKCPRPPTFWPSFPRKIKNLTRLISVLSLPFKFVQNHKSCPNSWIVEFVEKLENLPAESNNVRTNATVCKINGKSAKNIARKSGKHNNGAKIRQTGSWKDQSSSLALKERSHYTLLQNSIERSAMM